VPRLPSDNYIPAEEQTPVLLTDEGLRVPAELVNELVPLDAARVPVLVFLPHCPLCQRRATRAVNHPNSTANSGYYQCSRQDARAREAHPRGSLGELRPVEFICRTDGARPFQAG
jgi:hypothetical protein